MVQCQNLASENSHMRPKSVFNLANRQLKGIPASKQLHHCYEQPSKDEESRKHRSQSYFLAEPDCCLKKYYLISTTSVCGCKLRCPSKLSEEPQPHISIKNNFCKRQCTSCREDKHSCPEVQLPHSR